MYFYIRDKKINMSNYLIILYIIRVAKKLASNRRLKHNHDIIPLPVI